MTKFKTKTVFVLGAGASAVFGMPTSKSLSELIIKRSEKGNPNIVDHSLIIPYKTFSDEIIHTSGGNCFHHEVLGATNSNVNSDTILKFHNHFKGTISPSIDTFLHLFPDHEIVGKLFIIQTILRSENYNLLNNSDNWYRNLWKILYPKNIESLAESFENISFVTFNYDRTLEVFLYDRLCHLFRDSKKADDFFQNHIKLFHVYGQVSRYAEKINNNSEMFKSYGILNESNNYNFEDIKYMQYWSQYIKVIGERNEHEQMKQIHKLIEVADRVIFLGFSFEQANLDLLKIARNKYVMGTFFGLSKWDMDRINDQFSARKDFIQTDIDGFMHNYLTS